MFNQLLVIRRIAYYKHVTLFGLKETSLRCDSQDTKLLRSSWFWLCYGCRAERVDGVFVLEIA